jgi:RNA polymerase sigma-70 factor (ECF subfamily)
MPSHDQNKESDLVAKISSGDKNAFEVLFKKYYAELVRFAFHITNSFQASEDIVQDVFVNVWEFRSNLKAEKSIKIYLYRSVKNRALNFLKHKKFENFAEGLDDFESDMPEFDPELNLYHAELEKMVNWGIEQLPEKCRLIFRLHRQNGLTYQEIAQILDISVKTVEIQIGRALKTLRKLLTPYLH